MIKLKMHILPVFLSLLLTLMISAPAYAMGNDPDPLPVAASPGEPLAEESDISTRDLLYDKATNKQFVTIQDREGNTFYLVIDYDSPTVEDEEQFKTYFLNPVDASDLAALAKEEQTKPVACTCTEKCMPGKINMNCPVCASNMTECAGQEVPLPTAEADEPAQEEPEVTDKPNTAERPKRSAASPVALVVLGVISIGGILFVLLKRKPKKASSVKNVDDYDEYVSDEDPWETEGEESVPDTEDESENVSE